MSDQDKVAIFAADKKWEAKKTTRIARQAKTDMGQAHIQVSVEDVNEHQDDYIVALAFIQANNKYNAIEQHKQRETLKPTYLYLDSISSFYQVFSNKYLEKVKEMGVTLRGKCNAGMVFLNEKDMLLDMFCMWLVRNGIANLLSIPCLEHDRYQVTYDTNMCWIVKCPNDLTLKFKKDVGACEGFPYIDLENLKEYVTSDGRSVTGHNMKKKLIKKLKLLSETPKIKADTFIQSVRENMEGFTRRNVKEANDTRKAQASLAHLPDTGLLDLVSLNSGISNIPVAAHIISDANAIYNKY